jgi:hypothetical protein
MVVFRDVNAQPQTYLDRLRRFVNTYYARSDIAQSYPTIMLRLNHIKFDLVPAIGGYFTGAYRIPGPSTGYSAWIDTNPNDFNARLTQANRQHKSLIKPLVRLMKYWNAYNGYIFESYALERHIVDNSWYGDNLKEYLFNYVQRMSIGWSDAQWRKDRMQRAKDIVQRTAEFERQGKLAAAEAEIKKLLPVYW